MSNPSLQLLVRRSEVEPVTDYSIYKDKLREDFYYACSYCGITESEAKAIGFEIDHYKPIKLFAGERNNYTNLMWSCRLCNRRKDSYYHNELQKTKGYWIIKIDEEDPRPHFQISGLRLEGVTETGRFNIAKLDLNRHYLKRIRELRKENYDTDQFLIHGFRELLTVGIDNIPAENRTNFMRARDQAILNYKEVSDTTESIICDISKSDLLDDDPEYKERTREIKKYLKEVNAISTDSKLPDTEELKPRKKKSQKKRRKKK